MDTPLLNKRYKLVALVKEGIGGNVYKAKYTTSSFRTRNCIIKEERYAAAAHDLRSPLEWQAHVHKTYAAQEYVPKCIDYFHNGTAAYLVLEFIEGRSLASYLQQVNVQHKSWYEQDPAIKKDLIHILLSTIAIIHRFHKKGYIHRGISTSDLFIDRRKRVYIINTRLAWSPLLDRSHPPFFGGSPGFIPPEQAALCAPTEKEDVYGIGALMIALFTGLDPAKFCCHHTDLANDVYFLTGSKLIGELVKQCLSVDPQQRPGLDAVSAIIEKYEQEMEISGYTVYDFHCINEYKEQLQQVLSYAALGLVYNSSFKEQKNWPLQLSILYLLAGLKKNNINVQDCIPFYYQSFTAVKDHYLFSLSGLSAGLNGGAGLALALSAGFDAGLIPDTDKYCNYLLQCLQVPSISGDLNTGAAGQGMALYLCRNYMGSEIFAALLQEKVTFIRMLQQKQGYWLQHTGFMEGNTGIAWFLLHYIAGFKDAQTERTVSKALHWISERTNQLQDLLKVKSTEIPGVLLTFIKAYEVLRIQRYKTMVEKALARYPRLPVCDNYTQMGGLAALGEVYLEAFRVFKRTEWKLRANWIENVFLHTHCSTMPGAVYWITDKGKVPSANHLAGNADIMHFLLRCVDPEAPALLLRC